MVEKNKKKNGIIEVDWSVYINIQGKVFLKLLIDVQEERMVQEA